MQYDYNKIIEIVKTAKKFVFDAALKKDIMVKGEADFVTQVDLSISTYIKDKLFELYPQTGFMSEEIENNDIVSNRFILDPIDGTTNLIYNYKLSSISLALMIDGKIVFGVVYNPFYEELYTAIKGRGAYFNGEKIPLVIDRPIKDCLIEFGAGSTRKFQADNVFDLAKKVFLECLDLRRICSSALAICYIAQGRLNGYFETHLKPWDYAAAYLVLSECGGILTDWNNNIIQYDVPSTIVCGTPKAHAFLLEKINTISW